MALAFDMRQRRFFRCQSLVHTRVAPSSTSSTSHPSHPSAISMPPLHKQLRSAILSSIPQSAPRFMHYLTEYGLGPIIANASASDLEGNSMVGEAMMNPSVADFMLSEAIPTKYYGSISTHIVEPGIFHALLDCESDYFDDYAPDSTVPHAIVTLFMGTLVTKLGFQELQAWFAEALGPAVRAAAKVCAEYSRVVDEAEGVPRKRARTTERVRNVSRLAEAAQALSGEHQPEPEPRVPVPRMPIFDSRFLGVPASWSSYARKTMTKFRAAARVEYDAFMAEAFPKDQPPLENPFEAFMIGFRSSNLFRPAPAVPPETPVASGTRRRRSCSVSPARVNHAEDPSSPKRRRVD
ncbi:hypothetical protein FB45DRAFT_41182 [Roridomyces roridus]|uniref:Uncharacterized protein n=1 Tax=Roridomyces roridus TaxID=1738132 RepID=A0AAD7BRM8_9AGAR|nr:hypothetical protein FB45DRAFT_41182 [Roridomyces roridus]